MALVVAVFLTLLSFQLRPFWAVLDDHLAPDLGDPLFNLVVLEWDMHQLREGLPDVWHLPIYHPFESSLLLSDHLLGTALQAWGLTALTGSPVAAYNLLFFASFLLSALSTYAVLRASRLSAPAAFLGAAAFAMSPFRWTHASHLQVLLMQWIPVTLFFWDRLLAEPRGRWGVAFGAAYVLHLCGGTYLAYMIHLPLLVLLLNRGLRKGRSGRRVLYRWLSPRSLRVLAPAAAVTAVAASLVFLPYLRLPFDLERREDEFRIFGTTTPSLLTPGLRSPYYERMAPLARTVATAYPKRYWAAEKQLFPGFLPTLLGIMGLWVFLRRGSPRREPDGPEPDAREPDVPRRKPSRPPDPDRIPPGRRWILRGLWLTAGLAFFTADVYTFAVQLPENPTGWLRPGRFYDRTFTVMAVALIVWAWLRRRWLGRIGPPGWRRLPVWPRGVLLVGLTTLLLGFPGIFEPFSDRVPGLAGMRAPSRFFTFTSFALAFFAARGFDALRRRGPRPRHTAATAAVLLLLVVELTPERLAWIRRPEPPASHHWIAANEEVEVVLELPLQQLARDARYMSSASLHWKPLANGYSGHAPDHYWQLRRVCCWPVPEARALALIRELGVSHVLIHGRAVKPWARERLAEWHRQVRADEVPGVRQVYGDATGDLIFAVSDASDGAQPERKEP